MVNHQSDNHWFRSAYPELYHRINSTTSNPDLAVTPSKQGDLTLRIGNVQMHSAYNPVEEAERLADEALKNAASNSVIVVCGLGLGYHIESICRRFQGKVVVVEPDPAIVKLALTSRDLTAMSEAALAFALSVTDTAAIIERACNGDWKRIKLFKHHPSIKLHPEYYEELTRIINARCNLDASALGILVVTPIYGGSLPVARYCASAFERLGHRVETLDNQIYDAARRQIDTISSNRLHRSQLTALLTTLMAESITARALDRAVDLVFLTAQSPMTPEVAQELRRRRIPTAFWFVEDWQLFTYWQQWAPLYDYFFTIQKGAFQAALERIDVRRTTYLPLAADPKVHRKLELTPEELVEFGSDVSHVGAGYLNRQYVFSGLIDLDFKLWGNDWEKTASIRQVLQRDGARLATEESVKVFNASKININLHSSQMHEGVNPDGDYVNPRTFEIAACGGFQLTDHRSLLPELFEEGKEIITFRHERELRTLIDRYLADPDERNRIAELARRRTLTEHTYEIRMAEALNFIYSYESAPASRQHPDHIDNLLSEAKDEPELYNLLSRFKDRGVVTIDDIALDIQQRDGELSDPESIFLLMHEFRNWAKEKDLV